jgi:hypothetical protein
MVEGQQVCAVNGCVALARPGEHACAVHARVTQRCKGDAVIFCYACGERVRVGGRWAVSVEGALHLRAACLTKAPTDWFVPLGPSPRYGPRMLARWYPKLVA